MEIDLRSGELSLEDNQPVRLHGAHGLRITCTAGVIWITLTGVSEDIFLHPGQSCRVANNRLTLVESIGGGKVRFEPAKGFLSLTQMRKEIQNLIRPLEALRFAGG